MDNFQLLRLARKVPHFRGVFMRNELKSPKRNESAILNLDTKRGTHWVAYVKRGNVAIYFDPFGLPPPVELIRYLKNTRLFYFTDQVQRLTDTNCGQLCLKFLNKKWIHLRSRLPAELRY